MKKTKILAILLIIITLIGVISHIALGRSRTQLVINDSQKTKWLNYDQMANQYNNVYCVEYKQDMRTSRQYTIKTKVVIKGETAEFYTKKSGSNTYTLAKTVNNRANNVLGCILTDGRIDGKKGVQYGSQYTYGYSNEAYSDGSGDIYTDAQLGLYGYLNTWIDAVGAKEYGFAIRSNFSWAGSSLKNKAKTLVEQAETKADEYSYNVTLYLLLHYEWQDLIVTDPDDPTPDPSTLDIPVTKVWLDNNNKYETRPNEITVKLLANDKDTGKILTLNEGNNWTGAFTELEAKDENKDVIQYTIEEITEVPGYITSKVSGDQKSGFAITNRLQTEVTVRKEWNDEDNLDELRTDSITVTLYANGTSTNKTVTLNESNNWTQTFTDLYKCDINGNPIDYTVQEENIEGYTAEFEKSEDSKGNISYIIRNTHKPNYEGYIEITGKVWSDGVAGKGNDINGTLGDEWDKGLSGIIVTLKDADGYKFDDTSTTVTRKDDPETPDINEAGTYTIKVNYDNRQNVYKLYKDANTVKEKLKTAYVEFEYDALKYTTVANATYEEAGETSSANKSKAIEDENARNSFDSTHSTVTPLTNTDTWKNEKITAITKNVISFKNYEDKTTATRQEVLKYCNGNGNENQTYSRTNPDGAWKDIITNDHTCTDTNCTKEGHDMRKYNIEIGVIQNVNLGLFEREQPIVRIFSDLSEVEVRMKDETYTYLYDVRNSELKAKDNLQAKFQDDKTYQYTMPVNPAVISEINREGAQDNEMEVFVTYKVHIGNLSTTLPTTVNRITNAYDSNYMVPSVEKRRILEDGTEQLISKINYETSEVYGEFTEFNEITLNDLNIAVNAGSESKEIIVITYKINQQTIKGLLNNNATLYNAVEIESYSTQYGEKTLYAEQRTHEIDIKNGLTGRSGQSYAGYDYNSHPGNAGIFINGEGILEAAKPEEDTDLAPSFVLCKDDEYKALSGTVWEDSDENADDTERLGNGLKEDGENKLQNVKVELYDLNSIDANGNYQLAKLYGEKRSDEGYISVAIDAVTYTNEDGEYSFKITDAEDITYGIVPGNYYIKYTYGNADSYKTEIVNIEDKTRKEVNGRNYKSTIITETENPIIYGLFNGNEFDINTTNTNWPLDIEKTDYIETVAIDNMEDRMAITDLTNATAGNRYNITAYTKQFRVGIELVAGNSSSVDINGNISGVDNKLDVFNFGIIERPREEIEVSKTVSNIKITLANGQELINGNPNNNISYVKPMGNDINTANPKSRRVTAEIDLELIQGGTLEVEYAITVTNKSETDYDYYEGEVNAMTHYNKDNVIKGYYYYGNSSGLSLIKPTIKYVVDYMDADIVYKPENEDWKKITSAEDLINAQLISNKECEAMRANGINSVVDILKEAGLINEEVHKELSTNKYQILGTTAFKDVVTGSSERKIVTASKLLANQTTDYSYDNHVEVLKIGGKIARASATGDTRPTPGNYVPGEGPNERDDDNIDVIVTSPQGTTNYIITYIMAGLVGLVVLVVGVILIKKKVLTK